MKRILRGILIGGLLTVLVAIPVLAAYYAYITVTESNGNSYEELPIMASRNISQLAQYGLMTSTGLDTRVLTGDGYPLPHMLAEDKVLFVSDLAAHETKTLVFYLGATSLSSFPIIVGYNGSFKTPNDPDLELGYVMELLVSGYFDASAGAGKNILYKEGAFRMWISAANTLKVATYNSTGDEQWEVHYSSFTSGDHIVYLVANGLSVALYVDNFDMAKDTENLFDSANVLVSSTGASADPWVQRTFYAQGKYWCFYMYSGTPNKIKYKTSVDGVIWSSEYTIDLDGADGLSTWSLCYRDGYVHIVYSDATQEYLKYRRGAPVSNSTITWSAVWQVARHETVYNTWCSFPTVGVNSVGYPMIAYKFATAYCGYCRAIRSGNNDGTWSTDYGPTDFGGSDILSGSLSWYWGDDKMYVVFYDDGDHNLYGRYYNGYTWAASSETISSGQAYYYSYDSVADAGGNVYIVWQNYYDDVYLRIRYADGSFGSPILLSSNGQQPNVSYNTENGYIYVIYGRKDNGYCVAFTLVNGTLSGEYPLFTDVSASLSVSDYGQGNFGILHGMGTAVNHCYIDFYWDWNDNDNDWYWMQNNVMPYANDFQMGIDGVLQLEYKPDSIIQGTTLPDEELNHDAIITWGSNPSGVSAVLSPFNPSEEEETVPFVAPGMATPQDVVGPTGNPGITADVGTLAGNPFYPLVKALSDNTNIPVQLWWIILASIIVMICMVVTYKYLPHQIITVLVGGGLVCFFYALGIYPFWVIFIFVVMALAIIIGERSPTV